jgi:hypothetical protein
MIRLGTVPPDDAENQWRYQLDRFVIENQAALAALAWGLRQEWGDSPDALGIDLSPTPHFVCCSRDSLEQLNTQVNRQIQEILGVLDGHDPNLEVAIVGIGIGQIKLIHYQPPLPPPDSFREAGENIEQLIEQLESQLTRLVFLPESSELN